MPSHDHSISQNDGDFSGGRKNAAARLRKSYGAAGSNMNRTAQVRPIFRKTAETFMAGAKTLEQKYFVSPQIFAEEREKIFSRQWVLVGHQSQIAEAGDYFTAEVSGESFIVVRDKHGFGISDLSDFQIASSNP